MRSVFRIIALSTFAVATGCGGGGYNDMGTPAPTPTPTPSASAVTINITGQNGTQSFSPNPVDAAGMQVIFHNADTIVHRVILNDGTLDTGDIAPVNTTQLEPAAPTANGIVCDCPARSMMPPEPTRIRDVNAAMGPISASGLGLASIGVA